MKLWFDLDNSPHVPLFKPIFTELQNRKIDFQITARDFAQTLGLLQFWNIPHHAIGAYGGKNKLKKVLNLFRRTSQLKKFAANKNFSLAVSHGSRSLVMAARGLKIKSVVMLDYEWTESKIFNRYASWLLMPSVIPDSRLKEAGFNLKKIIRYNGLKEELYLPDFIPESGFREKLGVPQEKFLITIRTPGMTGNYHNTQSEILLAAILKKIQEDMRCHALLVTRTKTDKDFAANLIDSSDNIFFLNDAVDGLQLLYASDVFISGGGTMNRESALLGTKTYSIFTGKKAYVDEWLAERGLLVFISTLDEAKNITFEKSESKKMNSVNKNLRVEITDIVLNLSEF